jgi:hypothetical protein
MHLAPGRDSQAMLWTINRIPWKQGGCEIARNSGSESISVKSAYYAGATRRARRRSSLAAIHLAVDEFEFGDWPFRLGIGIAVSHHLVEALDQPSGQHQYRHAPFDRRHRDRGILGDPRPSDRVQRATVMYPGSSPGLF